jgi:hypothetical protein
MPDTPLEGHPVPSARQIAVCALPLLIVVPAARPVVRVSSGATVCPLDVIVSIAALLMVR